MDTIDVKIGKKLATYLETVLGLPVQRTYSASPSLEEAKEKARAFLVMDGMGETPIGKQLITLDLRYTVWVLVPVDSLTEAEKTVEMDRLMGYNYLMSQAFFQRHIAADNTLGRVVLIEAVRAGQEMYDPDRYTEMGIFSQTFSLTVRYTHEVERGEE